MRQLFLDKLSCVFVRNGSVINIFLFKTLLLNIYVLFKKQHFDLLSRSLQIVVLWDGLTFRL